MSTKQLKNVNRNEKFLFHAGILLWLLVVIVAFFHKNHRQSSPHLQLESVFSHNCYIVEECWVLSKWRWIIWELLLNSVKTKMKANCHLAVPICKTLTKWIIYTRKQQSWRHNSMNNSNWQSPQSCFVLSAHTVLTPRCSCARVKYDKKCCFNLSRMFV